MFKKILIANRGEIACRVIRTAKKMGVETVAVYSDADKDALHVKMADEAVRIGAPPAAHSYLMIDRIVQACKDTGAEAVHPGYGFLAENAAFADSLGKAGVVFIGPPVEAITLMGDKITSKELARKAGVNTIPGAAGAAEDAEDAVRAAGQIGYPVMLKASAGGGGKGMRIAYNDDQCREGLERAASEAQSSFGDSRVFVEKYIQSPRHIEIQVLADAHGAVIQLGERECSLQRRHQKVIEEAPSPFLDDATRAAMGAQAVALAKAVGYRSAGTVEFVVDENKTFYFLEMNTRLQVEHPVTEMTTGLDLVELMIRIAAGERLPVTQDEVVIHGWSIEARVYAEDPFRNFLPSVGRLTHCRYSGDEPFVRVDTGVLEGDEVSIHYDPLLAKIITSGPTRDRAIEQMRAALDECYIRGVSHNVSFLAALMSHSRFVEGRLSTDFIAEEYPDGFHAAGVPHDDPALLLAVAATIHRKYQDRAAAISGQMRGLERTVNDDWIVVMNKNEYPVTVRPVDGGCEVTHNGETHTVRSAWRFGQPLFRGEINGASACLQVERHSFGYRLLHRGSQTDVFVLQKRAAELNRLMIEKEPPDLSRFLLSPMPGQLVSLSVKQGDDVRQGERLAVVEAMKMENVLSAEQDGRVKAILAGIGANLAVDQAIIEFE